MTPQAAHVQGETELLCVRLNYVLPRMAEDNGGYIDKCQFGDVHQELVSAPAPMLTYGITEAHGKKISLTSSVYLLKRKKGKY